MRNSTLQYRALDVLRKGLPIVAVDLGYSANGRTCGIATSDTPNTVCYRFGEAIPVVAELCRERCDPVLVLEAVLSTSHCAKGNPRIRGAFEKGRGWYWGPGAVTMIAALRFLTELETMLPKSRPLWLAEAFLSNKAQRTHHSEDAQLIAQQFWRIESVALAEGGAAILSSISGIPPVRSFAYAP